jgi:hypothetical protein
MVIFIDARLEDRPPEHEQLHLVLRNNDGDAPYHQRILGSS